MSALAVPRTMEVWEVAAWEEPEWVAAAADKAPELTAVAAVDGDQLSSSNLSNNSSILSNEHMKFVCVCVI